MTCMDGAVLRKVFVKKTFGMHEIYYNIENYLFVPVPADEKRDWRKIELLKGQRTRRQKEKKLIFGFSIETQRVAVPSL